MRISTKAGLIASTAFISLCGGTAAFAQSQPADVTGDAVDDETGVEEEDIIVVGVRQALETAADIKRESDTFVDSITATDIGAFPDKSVAEALQRVPGVTVSRNAYRDDATHFAAEPSTVLVRGLLQVRSEFNGRDTFSATSSYGLNYSDVSPDLLAGVDTYKNASANMIEGGIAGTVNIRTRLPFDQSGQLVSVNLSGIHNNLSGKITPSASGIYSNRFETGIGEFGFMANAAYSKVKTISQGMTLLRPLPFAEGTFSPQRNYVPGGMTVGRTLYDRGRIGVSLAAQWENTSKTLLATAQYNKSTYNTQWDEDAVLTYWRYVDPATNTHSTLFTDADGLTASPFVFDSDGVFQSGVIAPAFGWGYGTVDWSSNPLVFVPGSTDNVAGTYARFGFNAPVFKPCVPPLNNNLPCRGGSLINSQTRFSDEKRSVEDISFQLKWTPDGPISAILDAQHVKAKSDKYDITWNLRTYANIGLDLTGRYPQMNLLTPDGYNLMPGPTPYSDYRNYSNDSAMDHREDSDGKLTAVKLDLEYDFGSDWLDDLSLGARYADRQQEHKWSAYNWASISADWGTNPVDAWFLDSGPTYNADGSIRFQGYEPGYYETRNFGSNILNGQLLTPNNFVFMRRDILRDPAATAARFSVTGQTDQGGLASSTWNPICDRPDELPDSCYTRGEILDVREKTLSGYAMLRFGGDNAELFSGIKVRGNVGVRIVETKVGSAGALNFAQPFTAAQLNCVPLTPAEIAALPANAYAISISCLAAASIDDQNFSNGGFALSTATNSQVNVLPSLNLRLDLSDGLFVRFAASKAISKPDIGLLRNYVTMNRVFVPQSDIVVGNPNIVLNAAGQPVSYRYSYLASSGNPRLKPIRADQLDLSLEHYSEKLGNFSVALFYKKFHDYIQNGTFIVPVANNGVTRDVVVTGPVNGDGASIKGVELSYSGFFNFLPAPLDGFGIQANFTHLKNSGVKNSNLIIDTTGGNQVVASAILGNIDPGVLEGLSDNSYNLVLLYEKSRFGARLAYNWRSRFLTSVNDCCVGFPVWSKPQGFLDASLRYAITDNVEFSLQGSNLLRTKTRLMAQVEGKTALEPDRPRRFFDTNYYESDRRIEAGIRVKF